MNFTFELERDLDDPLDRQAERERRMREREAWEWEQADKGYVEEQAEKIKEVIKL